MYYVFARRRILSRTPHTTTMKYIYTYTMYMLYIVISSLTVFAYTVEYKTTLVTTHVHTPRYDGKSKIPFFSALSLSYRTIPKRAFVSTIHVQYANKPTWTRAIVDFNLHLRLLCTFIYYIGVHLSICKAIYTIII